MSAQTIISFIVFLQWRHFTEIKSEIMLLDFQLVSKRARRNQGESKCLLFGLETEVFEKHADVGEIRQKRGKIQNRKHGI